MSAQSCASAPKPPTSTVASGIGEDVNKASKHRIAIFNLNETRRDPRVLRIAGTLQRAGHTVRVFEMRPDGASEHEVVGTIDIQRVLIPQDYSVAAMSVLAREAPKAAEVIEDCHPAVMHFDGRGTTLALTASKLKEELNRARCYLQKKAPPARRVLLNEIMAIRSIMLINLELFRAAREFNPTFVIANDLDTLVAAYMVHTEIGSPVLFDAHEVYPEQLSIEMRSEFWWSFYTRLENKLSKFPIGGMTVCDSITRYFDEHYGVRGFITICNVPTIKLLPDPEILARRNSRRRILYHGAYFQYRGLDEIIKAAPMVDNADFVFRGIGSYETVLRQQAADLGVEDRVHFEPPVPVMELIKHAANCDIGLSPFVNVCKNTEFALPNKFFEYMMAGLAVVSSDLVEMSNLTNSLKIGRLLPSLAPEEIAGSLNAFLATPDKIDECRSNAYHAARNTYNWEEEEIKFLSFFNKIAA
jgi:glycogen(starch) synthase